MRKWQAFLGKLFTAVSATTLGLSGCVTEPSAITGKGSSYAYSWDQEQQIGKQSDAQIIQEYGLYNDPGLQDYVQRVGFGVLEESDLRDKDAPEMYKESPFVFRVLDSPVVNAFALPGGYVYVTRGLLTYLRNEAQLAGVLGHEIGHVAARHSAKQALKAQYGQLGLAASAILGQQVLGDAGAAQKILEAGGAAMQLLMTKYSRDDERQADRLGMEYSARRGYDVAQISEFFNVLDRVSQKEGVRLPSWQSTHPDPGEREATAEQMSEQYERPLSMKRVGRDELLEHLEGVVLGKNPREGFVQNGIFYHPELGFKFPVPEGWEVQNERAAVMIAEPSGRALIIFQIAPGKSAQDAASQFAQSQGVQVRNTQQTRVNGLDAVAVTAQAQLQQGPAALVAYFIEYSGKVFSFIGLSGSETFQAESSAFQRVATGFDRLQEQRILNAQPARIEIVTVDRSAPFSSFLPTSSLVGVTSEDLAIMNHVEPGQVISAGTKLKLPRVTATGRNE